MWYNFGMSIFWLSVVLLVVQLIVVAGTVSLWNKNKKIRGLVVLLLSLVFWTVSMLLFSYSKDVWVVSLSAVLFYVFGLLIPLGPMWIAVAYSRIKSKFVKVLLLIFPIVASFSIIPIHDMFMKNGNFTGYGATSNDSIYVFYLAYLALYIVAIFLIMIDNIVKNNQNKKIVGKLISCLVWMMLGMVIPSVLSLLMPYFGNYEFMRIGPLVVLISVPAIIYLVTTGEFFSFPKIIAKGFAYCFFGGLIAVGCFGVLVLTSVLVDELALVSTWARYIVEGVALIVSLIWIIILYNVGKIIVRKIGSDGYNEAKILKNISLVVIKNYGVKDLFPAVQNTLVRAFGVKRVDIAIFNQDITSEYPEIGDGLEGVLKRVLYGKKQSAVYCEEIRAKSDSMVMVSNDIEVVVPIVGVGGRVIGAILLSPRKRRFSRYYGETLEKVSAILSPFIQAAVFYEQINGFNTKLKQEVSDKTKKLRENNKELKKIDSLKDDLLTIASHQLRTPLTGIVGYADMLKDGDFGKLNSDQKLILNKIVESGQSMNQMLIDYLDAARIESGRFNLKKDNVNLSKVVDDEVARLQEIAKKYERELVYNRDSEDIEIAGDITRLKQVVLNMIDNAIYYGDKKVEVNLHKLGQNIVFTVKDDGIGVPKSEQPKLFTKMFRGSNAKGVRPDGSGIGLYVIKNVIEESGGELLFVSDEGKGSTFGFSFEERKK